MEIREHMKIVGRDGKHVGTVDRVEGDHIKLAKSDAPEGWGDRHHYMDKGLVQSVDGDVVRLSVDSDAVPTTEAKNYEVGMAQDQGIVRDERGEEQPKDKKRAQAVHKTEGDHKPVKASQDKGGNHE
jgi:hypothetical protein